MKFFNRYSASFSTGLFRSVALCEHPGQPEPLYLRGMSHHPWDEAGHVLWRALRPRHAKTQGRDHQEPRS